MAQVYVHGSRIPPPHFPDVGTRFYENPRQVPITPDPPPAHRSAPTLSSAYSSTVSSQQASSSSSSSVPNTGGNQQLSTIHLQHSSHQSSKINVIEREQRDKERSSIPGIYYCINFLF